MPTIIPAYEFRRRAREAMKTCMPILLVVALIATLPSLISQAVTLMTGADPSGLVLQLTDRLMQVMEKYGIIQSGMTQGIVVDEAQLMAEVAAVYDQYMQDLMAFLQAKGPIMLGLSLMVLIASPVLTLGMINALLHALRRQEFTVAISLSRMRYLLKALGLDLLIAVKLFAWMLPGMALMIAAVFLPETLMALAMIAGMILMIVLGVMAGYRYEMAMFVLADEPDTGVLGCIRRSCEVMRRRKMELFCLEISFIGWALLLSLVKGLFLGFGQVIGMTLGMFASLFLTVYTNCAEAAFYQEYAVGPVDAAEQTPETDELN